MQQRIEEALKTLETIPIRAVHRNELIRELWLKHGVLPLETLKEVESQMTPEQKGRYRNLLQIETDFWKLGVRLHDGRARQAVLRDAFSVAEAAPLLDRKRLMGMLEAHWNLVKDSGKPVPEKYREKMQAAVDCSHRELSEETKRIKEAILKFARGKR